MTQDLYYVESGYLTPDSGYFVYTADAEAAVSSQATMAVTVGVIKDCVSTITCVSTVAAVISHIHGADLVAFSNAAIATEINVIRNNNVALTSVFSAAIDAVRGIYVSAQADATASISIANRRVRYTEAAHSAAFSLACDATKILGGSIAEADATLFNVVSLSATADKFVGVELSITSSAAVSVDGLRTRFASSDLTSQCVLVSSADVLKDASANISSALSLTANNSRIRDIACSVSSAFTPTLTVDVFKNSFAVLDSVLTLSASANATKPSIASLISIVSVIASVGKSAEASSTINLSVNVSCFGAVWKNKVHKFTPVNAGITSVEKKFGNGSFVYSGTSSYASTPDSTDWDIGAIADASPWTFEFWMYPTATTSGNSIAFLGQKTTAGTNGWTFIQNQRNIFFQYRGSVGTSPNVPTITEVSFTVGSVTLNQWNHIKLERDDVTYASGQRVQFFGYINGTRTLDTNDWIYRNTGGSYSIPFNSSGPLYIGNASASISAPTTYIDSIHLKFGVTDDNTTPATITLPTAETTQPTAYSKLLLNFNDVAYDLSTITTQVGAALVVGQASLAFNGGKLLSTTANIASQITVLAEARNNADKNLSANLTTVSTLNCNGGKPLSSTANLVSQATLFASRNFGRYRPVELTNSGTSFNASVKKYGSHSLSIPSGSNVIFTNDNRDMEIPANTDFLIELWVNVNDGGILASFNNLLLTGVGDMTSISAAGMNSNDSWALGWAGSFPVSSNTKLTFKFATSAGTFTTIQTGEGAYSSNGWNHIVVRRLGSTIYLANNTTGDSASATYSGAIYQGTYKKLQLRNPFSYASGSSTTSLLIDEFNFKIGSVDYGSEDAATSQAINNPDTNVFLYHFNNSLADDVSVTFNQSAALSSIITASATISGPVRTTAALVSSSTLVAQVNKTAEINLVAFSNANVSTLGQRIRFAASDQSSASALAVNGNRIQQASSSQSSQFAQSTTVVKTVNPPIATEAIFSDLVAVAKTGAGFIQIDCVSIMSVTGIKTARTTAASSSQFAQTTNAVKSITANASINASAALTANNNRFRNSVIACEFNSQLDAQVGEIVQFAASLTAVSNFSCDTGGVKQFSAAISSQASVSANIIRVRSSSSDLACQLNLTANAGTIKTSAITTNAIFSELAAIAKTGQGLVTVEIVASQTTVAIKTARAQANVTATASLSITAARTRRGSAVVDSSFKQTTSAGKIHDAVCGTIPFIGMPVPIWFVAATLTANADRLRVVFADANINAAASLTCQPVKSVNAISLEASSGTLTASLNIIHGGRANLSALAFEIAVGQKIKAAQANIVSTSTVSAKIGGTFRFQSAMQGFAAEVAVIDIIHIDAKLTWMIFADDREYSIQSENRTYSIVEEDRDYSIVNEDREYAVTRELLTTELQGV